MDHGLWLERQYRALLVREGELLESMLALASVERTEGQLYTALKDELLAIGRYQSEIARSLGALRRREARSEEDFPLAAGAWTGRRAVARGYSTA
jgi:hypothetical protein